MWARDWLEIGIRWLRFKLRRLLRSARGEPCGEGCYKLDEATEVPVGEVVSTFGKV